jgi:hypothetical protein
VETKKDYREREQQRSPDEADAVTLLVHGVRLMSGVVVSMKAAMPGVITPGIYDNDEPVVVVGCTDKLEHFPGL